MKNQCGKIVSAHRLSAHGYLTFVIVENIMNEEYVTEEITHSTAKYEEGI